MVIGAVVSKVVTKITGNELLGAMAGMGAGGLMDLAGGATATAVGGAEAAAGAAAPDVVAGGAEGLLSGEAAKLAGGYAAEPITAQAAEAAALAPGGTAHVGGAVADTVAQATKSATTAGDRGGIMGLLEKGGQFMEKHPQLTKAAGGILSGMAESKEREEEREWAEEEGQRRYEREHQTFDPSKVRSLDDVNLSVGYRPYQTLSSTAQRERITEPTLPNYRQMLERYKKGGSNA
jgi:hypothetical protein